MTQVKSRKSFAHYLPVWGAVCTGLVYVGIGVIAILSFLQIKRGGADESSMLVYLNEFLAGKIFVWVILTGMVGLIIWRLYETVADPYEYGNATGGILRRIAIGLSSVADILIALSAIQAIFGVSAAKESGEPVGERAMAETILSKDWGVTVLIAVGIMLLITAVAQIGYAITKKYRERLQLTRFRAWKKLVVDILAWVGHTARAIILGIIGFFLLKAGSSGDASYVVNTDKAFDFIGDDVGHLYFLLVAAGTIAYGLFMVIAGVYYKPEKK